MAACFGLSRALQLQKEVVKSSTTHLFKTPISLKRILSIFWTREHGKRQADPCKLQHMQLKPSPDIIPGKKALKNTGCPSRRKAPVDKKPPKIKVSKPEVSGLDVPFKLYSKSAPGYIECTMPVYTASEANGGPKKKVMKSGKMVCRSEHWAEASKRHNSQKSLVAMMLKKYAKEIKLPCVITLTRFAPKKLDKFDNLPMSFKWILDAICEIITGDYRPGLADDSIEDEIDVVYKQETSKGYGVKIELRY